MPEAAFAGGEPRGAELEYGVNDGIITALPLHPLDDAYASAEEEGPIDLWPPPPPHVPQGVPCCSLDDLAEDLRAPPGTFRRLYKESL